MNTTGTDWLALGAWTAQLCLLALFAAELQAGEGLGADQGFKTGPMASHSGNLDHASWTQITNKAAFSPRDTAEGIVFAGRMWLSNGYYHGNKLTRDLWSSRDGVTWNLVLDNTPYDGYSEMVVYNNKMWAVKGSVWSSFDGKTWQRVAERTPFEVRAYGELVVFQGQMWQLGSGGDVWRSADGIDWTCVTKSAAYGNRAAGGVVVYDDRLWLMGGRTMDVNTPPEKHYPEMTTHNDVWSSKDGKTWTRITPHAPWSQRMWCVAAVHAGRMWLLGGYDNVHHQNLGDVWTSTDGKNWRQLKAEPQFGPRHEVTSYVHDGSLWVVAGNTWPVVNDVWRLTLGTDQE